MVKNGINFDKIKGEIESRRKEKNMIVSPLGEKVGAGIAPRDTFLFGLLESVRSGKQTASTNLVKMVDNKVAEKTGEKPKMRITEEAAPQQQQRKPIPMPTNEVVQMSPEREEQMYHDMEKSRKRTLADSIQQYVPTPVIGASTSNNPVQTSRQIPLNEQYLAENVHKIVNNYLVENFMPIFEEAFKESILEMYAVERIKEVLHENKDMVKTVVIEVIKEIQAKAKNKT